MIRQLDEFDEADVTLHRQLLDHFQEACGLAIDLDMCPRWRRRKRRRLAQAFGAECHAADMVKILLGARQPFPSTEQIIHEQMEAM